MSIKISTVIRIIASLSGIGMVHAGTEFFVITHFASTLGIRVPFYKGGTKIPKLEAPRPVGGASR